MKKLIILISLVSIVSCSAATTPKFPPISCKPTQELSDKQLSDLAQCKKDMDKCTVSRDTLLLIHRNYQNKSACLEQYQKTANKYQ